MVALSEDGEVFSWGGGQGGQLGLGSYDGTMLPKKISFPGKEPEVVCISAGDSHTTAVTKDGKLFTWGMGGRGRLGHGVDPITGEYNDELVPRVVEHGTMAHAYQAAAGGSYKSSHTLVLTAGGTVWEAKDEFVDDPIL